MANKSSEVCRDIVATKTVIQNKIVESLVIHLVATERIGREDCKNVSSFLNREVEVQMNSLIDRVLKTLQEN